MLDCLATGALRPGAGRDPAAETQAVRRSLVTEPEDQPQRRGSWFVIFLHDFDFLLFTSYQDSKPNENSRDVNHRSSGTKSSVPVVVAATVPRPRKSVIIGVLDEETCNTLKKT